MCWVQRTKAKVHDQTLQILERVGVGMSRPMKSAAACGRREPAIDDQGRKAFFSPEIVERALATAPAPLPVGGPLQ